MIPLGWIEKGGKRSPVRRDVRERCSDANLERIAPCQENVFAFVFSFSGGEWMPNRERKDLCQSMLIVLNVANFSDDNSIAIFPLSFQEAMAWSYD